MGLYLCKQEPVASHKDVPTPDLATTIICYTLIGSDVEYEKKSDGTYGVAPKDNGYEFGKYLSYEIRSMVMNQK